MKFKHQLIIEVTLDREVTESMATSILNTGLRSASITREANRFYVNPVAQVHNIKVKRLSKVLPYLIKPKE